MKEPLWKIAVGRYNNRLLFDTAQQLLDCAAKYFEWIDDNPIEVVEAFPYQGSVSMEDMPRARVMTYSGLCAFLGISHDTWQRYRVREDFHEVVALIDQAIYEQKFTGAAAGIFNASLISRDLGLAEKTTSEISGPNGGAIPVAGALFATQDPNEAAQAYKALMDGKND